MRRALLAAFVLSQAAAAGFADERMDLRRDAIVEAVEKASPAVVNISTEKIIQRGFFFGDQNPFNDPVLDQFMQQFSRPEKAQSLGSGGIFAAEGYIFTNAHVVNLASKIVVTLSDGSQHPATLVNVDVASDLAVIKINVDKPLPVLVLGRSDDLMVGERAIAVGNPFGLSSSVTEGVISALHREVVAEGRVLFKDILQTDALINPGNSGGPLLNVFGEVIGVTTAMRADAQGIGFAIPVDRVKRSLAGLLDYRKLRRMRLGVALDEKYEDTSPLTRISIRSVEPEGPSAGKGIEPGDAIVAIDGRRISNLVDLMLAIASGSKDDVVLVLSRNGREFEVTIRPTVIPKPDAATLAQQLLGLSVQQMESKLSVDVGINVDKGVLVNDVKKGSPSAEAGLEGGDIIIQVNDTLTADLESFALALEAAQGSSDLYLVIIRREQRAIAQYQVAVKLRGKK